MYNCKGVRTPTECIVLRESDILLSLSIIIACTVRVLVSCLFKCMKDTFYKVSGSRQKTSNRYYYY